MRRPQTTMDAFDLAAVADAVRARRAMLGLTQRAVVAAMPEHSRISLDTYQKIEQGRGDDRRPTTLATVSQALGWEPDHLWRLATGESPAEGPSPTEVVALTARLDQVEAELDRVSQRTEDLARTNEQLAELLERLVQRLHPDDTGG